MPSRDNEGFGFDAIAPSDTLKCQHAIAAAAKDGNLIAAAGTHPFSHWEDQQLTLKDGYKSLQRDYQQLTRELVIFGFRIHVGISSRSCNPSHERR